MNIVKLHRSPADDINEILEDAFASDFSEIIVFGIKDENVMIWHSSTVSRARTLGALEMAKYDLLKGDP